MENLDAYVRMIVRDFEGCNLEYIDFWCGSNSVVTDLREDLKFLVNCAKAAVDPPEVSPKIAKHVQEDVKVDKFKAVMAMLNAQPIGKYMTSQHFCIHQYWCEGCRRGG